MISRRAAEDSVKDVGALPLLSYTLDDMWTGWCSAAMACCACQLQSFELGGVLVDRANRFLETHPGAEDALRRVLTLRSPRCAKTASRPGAVRRVPSSPMRNGGWSPSSPIILIGFWSS